MPMVTTISNNQRTHRPSNPNAEPAKISWRPLMKERPHNGLVWEKAPQNERQN